MYRFSDELYSYGPTKSMAMRENGTPVTRRGIKLALALWLFGLVFWHTDQDVQCSLFWCHKRFSANKNVVRYGQLSSFYPGVQLLVCHEPFKELGDGTPGLTQFVQTFYPVYSVVGSLVFIGGFHSVRVTSFLILSNGMELSKCGVFKFFKWGPRWIGVQLMVLLHTAWHYSCFNAYRVWWIWGRVCQLGTSWQWMFSFISAFEFLLFNSVALSGVKSSSGTTRVFSSFCSTVFCVGCSGIGGLLGGQITSGGGFGLTWLVISRTFQ